MFEQIRERVPAPKLMLEILKVRNTSGCTQATIGEMAALSQPNVSVLLKAARTLGEDFLKACDDSVGQSHLIQLAKAVRSNSEITTKAKAFVDDAKLRNTSQSPAKIGKLAIKRLIG